MNSDNHTKEKWGLCFAGGGGKGAYEIGVWKALEECTSIQFEAVSGASVGALNAALYATTNESEAERIWAQVTPDLLLKPTPKLVKEVLMEAFRWTLTIKGIPMYSSLLHTYSLYRNIRKFKKQTPLSPHFINFIKDEGIFSRDGLKNLITSSEILNKINSSEIKCYASVYESKSSGNKAKYFLLNQMPKEDVLDALLASSAIPIAYAKQDVSGKYYRDGGIKDNLPIAPLIEYGCTHIVTVNLKQSSLKLNYRDYFKDNIHYYEIYPSNNLKGLLGTFDFTQKTIQKLINAGYDDGKIALKDMHLF